MRKLSAKCKKCKHKVHVRSFASGRTALAESKGDPMQVTCKECGVPASYMAGEFKMDPKIGSSIVGTTFFVMFFPITIVVIGVKFGQAPMWVIAALIIGLAAAYIGGYYFVKRGRERKAAAFNKS